MTAATVYRREMPDGATYELRRGGHGWQARRADEPHWATAHSIAFALIHAAGHLLEPMRFAAAAHLWEREVRRDG
jgi:hypothetical protein